MSDIVAITERVFFTKPNKVSSFHALLGNGIARRSGERPGFLHKRFQNTESSKHPLHLTLNGFRYFPILLHHGNLVLMETILEMLPDQNFERSLCVVERLVYVPWFLGVWPTLDVSDPESVFVEESSFIPSHPTPNFYEVIPFFCHANESKSIAINFEFGEEAPIENVNVSVDCIDF